MSTLTDPGGVGLTFAYDGSLPVTETYSGAVDGVVGRTFTNNFEVATESVNGTRTVTFGYDADRLLTQAGTLTIARDAATGLVSGTTLGITTEALQHNTRAPAQSGQASASARPRGSRCCRCRRDPRPCLPLGTAAPLSLHW